MRKLFIYAFFGYLKSIHRANEQTIRLDYTNNYVFMYDWIAQIIMFSFHARLDHTNNYVFMYDWIIQIIMFSCMIGLHK
jgi:hypothetical protein